MARAALASLALLAAACTTPLERGEERYQQGDRSAALALWREIPPASHQYAPAQQRISAVEDEQQKLVTRYQQRGRYFERRGRLAESILSFRVVMKLAPDDRDTLAHVQDLSRRLATRKSELDSAWRTALAEGRLTEARARVRELRELDPFDPAAERGERQVDEALGAETERLLADGRRGFSSGDYDTAGERFREVLALEPENESAQGYLAYMDAIRESERTRPPEPTPTPTAGRPATRRDTRALRATDTEIRAEGFHRNALAAEKAGDPYAAIRHEQRALAVSPGHASSAAHLAALRARLAPEVPGLIDAGRAAFQQEDLETALDQWRRALLVEPDNERATQYVARAEKLLQNLELLRAEPAPPPARAVGSRR